MPAPTGDEYIGLCATCIHAPTCVYRARRGYDAVYCEMFDDSPETPPDPQSNNPNNPTPHGHTASAQNDKTHEPEQIKGLCINCAHRDTCRLPRPRGGVWHCEEYA